AHINKPKEFHFQGRKSKLLLVGVLLFYFLITYGNIVISYYLPFTMQKYGLSTTEVGFVTSLFFLSITVPGFLLPHIIYLLKGMTSFVAVMLIAIGLFIMGFGNDGRNRIRDFATDYLR
ncbi:MAG: hypothetical protein RR346_10910, partial [Bacteroidales bacterium]